jgi:hypothetical protein
LTLFDTPVFMYGERGEGEMGRWGDGERWEKF